MGYLRSGEGRVFLPLWSLLGEGFLFYSDRDRFMQEKFQDLGVNQRAWFKAECDTVTHQSVDGGCGAGGPGHAGALEQEIVRD